LLSLRGPNGVWTLEEKGLKPEINISFDEAIPTITHMSIVKLVESGELYEYSSCLFIKLTVNVTLKRNKDDVHNSST
jgi:hypothetical protein